MAKTAKFSAVLHIPKARLLLNFLPRDSITKEKTGFFHLHRFPPLPKVFSMSSHIHSRTLLATMIFLTCAVNWKCFADNTQNDTPSFRRKKIVDVSNYTDAIRIAEKQSAMLLVSIRAEGTTSDDDEVTQQLKKTSVRMLFTKSATPWVFCQLDFNERTVSLIQSTLLKEIRGGPGVFVIDYAHESLKGQVVSFLPRRDGKYYQFAQQDLSLLARLPTGSLTQRSMILAVRRHADAPKSTNGSCDIMLCEQAAAHSTHQAKLQKQGHHGWKLRSQQISNHRGPAAEVCAESWPGQDLLDSCVDCVSCWRHSSGHWRAVSSEHSAFGYDIRRGENSIWYATSIFIR